MIRYENDPMESLTDARPLSIPLRNSFKKRNKIVLQ